MWQASSEQFFLPLIHEVLWDWYNSEHTGAPPCWCLVACCLQCNWAFLLWSGNSGSQYGLACQDQDIRLSWWEYPFPLNTYPSQNLWLLVQSNLVGWSDLFDVSLVIWTPKNVETSPSSCNKKVLEKDCISLSIVESSLEKVKQSST